MDSAGTQHKDHTGRHTSVSLPTVRPELKKRCGNEDQEIEDIVTEFLKDSLDDNTENNNVKEVLPLKYLEFCETSLSLQSTCESQSNKYTGNVDIKEGLPCRIKGVEDDSINLLSDDEESKREIFKQVQKSAPNPKQITISRVFSFSEEKLGENKSKDILDSFKKDDLFSRQETSNKNANLKKKSMKTKEIARKKSLKEKERELLTKLDAIKKASSQRILKENCLLDIPCRLSPELAPIVGKDIMTRRKAFQAVWSYVKKKCRGPGSVWQSDVICDRQLREVVNSSTTSYSNLRYLLYKTNKHMSEIVSVAESEIIDLDARGTERDVEYPDTILPH